MADVETFKPGHLAMGQPQDVIMRYAQPKTGTGIKKVTDEQGIIKEVAFNWTLYGVTVAGVNKNWFVTDQQYEVLKSFSLVKGQVITITRGEAENEHGKYNVYEITQDGGHSVPTSTPAQPSAAPTPQPAATPTAQSAPVADQVREQAKENYVSPDPQESQKEALITFQCCLKVAGQNHAGQKSPSGEIMKEAEVYFARAFEISGYKL